MRSLTAIAKGVSGRIVDDSQSAAEPSFGPGQGRARAGVAGFSGLTACSACLIANAAASVRLVEWVLLRMLRTWLATVFGLTNSSAAICRLLLPAATKLNTWTSRSLKPAG